MVNKPTYIDLFAGAGGLSEGFARAGFEAIAHIEADGNAAASLETRVAYWFLSQRAKLLPYYDYVKGDLSRSEFLSQVPEEILKIVIHEEIASSKAKALYRKVDSLKGVRSVDLIIGGPPCQAYSLVGRSRDPDGMVGDPRNYLFRNYARFLARYTPKYFLFENVLGLLSAGSRAYLDEMRRLFRRVGYRTDMKILNCEDYGVLQRRRRVFIIGSRGTEDFHFPELDKMVNDWKVGPNLLSDLPPLEPGAEMRVAYYSEPANEYLQTTGIRNGINFTTQHVTRSHSKQDLEIYAIAIRKWKRKRSRLKYSELPTRLQTHKNKTGFLDRFKVVDFDGHSHTMMAHISKDGHYYIYPNENQVRSLSVREAARIQSFPDDYYFEGGRTAAFRQIGNAVPPLLAEKLALKLKELVNGK